MIPGATVDVDLDLSFGATPESPAGQKPAGKPAPKQVSKAAQKPKQQSKPVPSAEDSTNPNLQIPKEVQQKPKQAQAQAQAQVRNINEHRKQAPDEPQRRQQRQQQQQQVRQTSQVQVQVQREQVGDLDYELQNMRDEINSLKEEMQLIKNHADLKVAVAEAKAEFVVEYITNGKLLDHQVNQVLQRIHTKVPGLKPEVLAIKKYMNEFNKKNG